MGEFDLSLIREFRSRPGFYDRNSPLFKDKVYNAREWQLIANKLGYDVSLLKDRMLQLRNRYNLEKRRLEQYHEENPGKHIESPWPLFEELTFLSEHIRARRSYKRLLPGNFNITHKLYANPYYEQSNSGEQHDSQQQQQQQQQNNQQQPSDEQQKFTEQQQFFHHHGLTATTTANTSTTNHNTTSANSINLDNSSVDTTTASHAAARFAANGLLTVKMEEDDVDDDDNQAQELSEDNFDTINGMDSDNELTALDTLHLTPYNSLSDKRDRNHVGNNISNNKKMHLPKHSYQQQFHKGKRFYLPSINKPKHHLHHQQQQLHHHQYRQQQQMMRQKHSSTQSSVYGESNGMGGGVSDYMKRGIFGGERVFNPREQKFAAFGNFMSSALLDLPQQKALMLVEKFTSEVVKVMLQKHITAMTSKKQSNNNNNDSICTENSDNADNKSLHIIDDQEASTSNPLGDGNSDMLGSMSSMVNLNGIDLNH